MLVQSYAQGETVLEASRRRIAWVFDHFDRIMVSVSGGKDSTVLLVLAMQEARRRGRKVDVFFLDEEVTYESTVKQVEYLMGLYPENTTPWWLQVPFYLTNATSLTDGQLQVWAPGDHKIWMRPKREDAIKARPWSADSETIRNRAKGFGFYDAIENFERMFTDTAFLVGLRGVESPNRWRTMTKHPVEVDGEKVYWGTRKGANAAFYPIHDWIHTDVWRFIHEEGVRYSRIYDLQFMKGYPINEMRVSSLVHERAFKAICDLPEFEPKTYARLLKRIKGIALAQERGKDAKLFKARKLPQAFKSWRKYRDFLLETHPDPDKVPLFRRRFATHLDNEYVARQQVRQLVLNDYENNLGVHSADDPRDALIRYYTEVL